MTITDNQARNLSAFFTILFAVNVGITIWNIMQQHKIREIEKEIAEHKLHQIKNGASV